MVQPIIFYDIPCTSPKSKAWSPSTWKTRYVLNIKGLPYTTEWVEYPDIAPMSKREGFQPTGVKDDGSPLYTLPAIYDPNTQQRISDSKAIVHYLDKTYPDTYQLLPKGAGALPEIFTDAFAETFWGLYATICRANIKIFNKPSYDYWLVSRPPAFGKKFEEIGTEEDWKVLEAGLGKVKRWLDSNKDGEGRLLLGDRITYVDVLLASVLVWTRVAVPETWDRIAALHDGRWVDIAEHFAQYEQVL